VLNMVATKRTTWNFTIDQEEDANEFAGETSMKLVGFIQMTTIFLHFARRHWIGEWPLRSFCHRAKARVTLVAEKSHIT